MTSMRPVDELDAVAVVDRLSEAAAAMRDAPNRKGSVSLVDGRGTLLVTGDLHDNPTNFAKVVRCSKIAEKEDAHVILHELIHGERLENDLDLSYRMLVKVASLVLEHPGRVHVLLANHELAQMAGHSVSKGGGCMTTLFDQGLQEVFKEEADLVASAIGEFVRALPLAARTENGVLCAHSLPGPTMMNRFDVGILDRELEHHDYDPMEGSAWMMVWGRGQSEAQMELLAEEWGVSLFCLGHAFVENGIGIGGPRTILLNSDHEQAMVLPIDLDAPVPTMEAAVFGAFPLASVEVNG